MNTNQGPSVDLNALSILQQITEYDFRTQRALTYPDLAVSVRFLMSKEARSIIHNRDVFYLAG